MLEEQLKNIMVEDCFVLSWATEKDQLSIEIEASIWPGHAEYSAPKPDEWTCYKLATLLFTGISNLRGLIPMSQVAPVPGLEVPPDYGSLDRVEERDGNFIINGPFGDLSFAAQNAQLIFNSRVSAQEMMRG